MKVKVAQSCPTLWNPLDYTVRGILQVRILECVAFPFSRGIFPTQGSNPGLPHCGRILYQLSHKGSPRILEWVAYPFSSGSSWPRNRTRVSCSADRFFTNWAIREAHRGQGSKFPLLEGIICMCYLEYFCKEWLSLLSYYFCLSFCWALFCHVGSMLWFIDLLFAKNVLSSWYLRVLFAPGHVGSYFPDQWLNPCPLYWKVDS